MNILPTAYTPQQGELLGKYELQKIDAIPEEVQNAMRDGLNDIRFNGYRWDCNPKTGWARVSPISSPANAEPESPEQSQADARADFLALQGEYLSVKPESKSEKKSATDIVNELRSKAAAKTSQQAPEQAETGEYEQTESRPETVSEKAVQDDVTTGDVPEQTSEKGIYCSYVCLGAARKAFIRTGYSNKAKATTWCVLSSITAAARKQNDGSWVAEVRQSDIAAEWGIDSRTVSRQTGILVNLGLIKLAEDYINGQHARRFKMLFQVENAR
ncbi:hypothetical protein FO266_000382 [Escherichia coli]|nr:hypothetical protein [Escherichia coli]